MMKIKIVLMMIVFLIIVQNASAFVIEEITTDKNSYKNGDLLKMTVYANAQNLEITGDFSKLDSNFDPRAVIKESKDFEYTLWYPITFSNTRSNDIYNIVVSAYSKETESSNIASYGVKLDNSLRINESIESESIIIRVRNQSNESITVHEGMIRICDSSGCTLLTEEEYEKARPIIISGGEVKLANLTYEQLKSEIIKEVNNEVKDYINQMIQISKDLNLFKDDMYIMMDENKEFIQNESVRNKQMFTKGIVINFIGALIVIIIILGCFYIMYLKSFTVWLD